MLASDRTQELKNFGYDEKLFNLERSLQNYVTREQQEGDMGEKASLTALDELTEKIHKLQAINVTTSESLTQRLDDLKDDFATTTKEMREQLDDLNKKMDDIDDEEGSYDEESDQDLDSELGDTLDVNDLNRDAKDAAASEEGKKEKRPKV